MAKCNIMYQLACVYGGNKSNRNELGLADSY